MAKNVPERPEGRREAKRRETRERILAVGLRLMLERGYDGTTLDEIAEAAGIGRRTFFYYFQSKDDLLSASYGSGFSQGLGQAMREEPTDQLPLLAARNCFLKLASRYETAESRAVDQLLRSTPGLRARKSDLFDNMAAELLDAMKASWSQAYSITELRLVAMMAIGALRLALADWRDDAEHALAFHIEHLFDLLDRQLSAKAVI